MHLLSIFQKCVANWGVLLPPFKIYFKIPFTDILVGFQDGVAINVDVQSTAFYKNNIVFRRAKVRLWGIGKEGRIKEQPFKSFIQAHSSNSIDAIPTLTPPHIRTWLCLDFAQMSLAFHSTSIDLKQVEAISFQLPYLNKHIMFMLPRHTGKSGNSRREKLNRCDGDRGHFPAHSGLHISPGSLLVTDTY